MMLRKIKMASLLSIVMMGAMSTVLPAATTPVVSTYVKSETPWTSLGTRDGVSCYYNIDQLGTCNNGVWLRFVNTTATALTVNFSVTTDGVSITKSVVIKAGETLDSSNDLSLVIRPLTAGKPVISFSVSK